MSEKPSIVAVIVAFLHKLSNAAEKGGAAVAVAGGLTATEIAAFGGLIVAALGFVVNAGLNWYYKAQHLKLAREQARADQNE